MARPTRTEAYNAPAADPNPTSEALQLLYALLASATNPDGTPFTLPTTATTTAATATPLGYAQPAVNANTGPAVGLTVPAGAKYVLVIPSVAVRWRDDGTAPTGTVGMPLTAGTLLEYDGGLAAIRFIAQGVAAGVLDVSFYA